MLWELIKQEDTDKLLDGIAVISNFVLKNTSGEVFCLCPNCRDHHGRQQTPQGAFMRLMDTYEERFGQEIPLKIAQSLLDDCIKNNTTSS